MRFADISIKCNCETKPETFRLFKRQGKTLIDMKGLLLGCVSVEGDGKVCSIVLGLPFRFCIIWPYYIAERKGVVEGCQVFGITSMRIVATRGDRLIGWGRSKLRIVSSPR